MIDYVTKRTRHMLWQDELGDSFILTKFGEIYESPKGKDYLRLAAWSTTLRNKLARKGLIEAEDSTDDPLWLIDFKAPNLPQIISLGPYKIRPDLRGATVREAEKRLAHKILPYRPGVLR